MTTAFATPPWVTRLTGVVESALPRGYVLLEAVSDRHGSWQWTARRDNTSESAGTWLVVAVTPLTERADNDVPGSISVAAWQVAADGAGIAESTLATREVADVVETQDPQDVLARAVREVVAEAAHPRLERSRDIVLHHRARWGAWVASVLALLGVAVVVLSIFTSTRSVTVVVGVVQGLTLVLLAAFIRPVWAQLHMYLSERLNPKRRSS